jgi:glycerate kinase
MRFQKILIAPDKFKGTLTATEAARAIERGLRAHAPDGASLVIRLLPIADGGEGTTDAVCAALPDARLALITTVTPHHEHYVATAAISRDQAFFEMAGASGLKRVPLEKRNPWQLNTLGTGIVLRALAAGDCTMADADTVTDANAMTDADGQRAAWPSGLARIHVGLGGSATNDAGIGIGAALGHQFLDAQNRDVEPLPENYGRIVRIVAPAVNPLASVEIIGLCDVTNPLLGPGGASHVYGPQKGLRDPERMDAALARIAGLIARDLGVDHRDTPGAGAAGGLGYGLMTFCGAKLKPGFDTIAELAGIEAAVRECDLVITGEGKLDSQTLFGKGPAELARLARREGKPVVAFGGCVETGAEKKLRDVFADIHTLSGADSAGAGAAAALEAAAGRFAATMQE